jgi:hypothetical protein
MLIVIFMFIFCKDNKKDDTMRDRNVKMWMNFSFLDRNVSDNEMDKKNEEYIKSGCGIGEKCEEIYISSIFDLSFPIFLLLLHVKPHENKSILNGIKLIFGERIRFVIATWGWKENEYPNGQVIKYRKVSWFWTYQRFDFSEKVIVTGYQLNGEDGIYLNNVEPEQFQNHLLYLEDIYSIASNLCIRLGF